MPEHMQKRVKSRSSDHAVCQDGAFNRNVIKEIAAHANFARHPSPISSFRLAPSSGMRLVFSAAQKPKRERPISRNVRVELTAKENYVERIKQVPQMDRQHCIHIQVLNPNGCTFTAKDFLDLRKHVALATRDGAWQGTLLQLSFCRKFRLKPFFGAEPEVPFKWGRGSR